MWQNHDYATVTPSAESEQSGAAEKAKSLCRDVAKHRLTSAIVQGLTKSRSGVDAGRFTIMTGR
jgi:hypothetical protein